MQAHQTYNRRLTEEHIMRLWSTYSGFYRGCRREYDNLICQVRSAGMRPCIKIDRHAFTALRSYPFLGIPSEFDARKEIESMDEKALKGLMRRIDAFKSDVYHLRVRDAIWELRRQMRRKGDWKIYQRIDPLFPEDDEDDD